MSDHTPAITTVAVYGPGGDSFTVVLTATGHWRPALRDRSAGMLRECLAARPSGLLIDLTALHDARAQSAPLWAGARDIGGIILPPVPVALCVGAHSALADHLQSRGAPTLLPVYATLGQATVALANRHAVAERRRTVDRVLVTAARKTAVTFR